MKIYILIQIQIFQNYFDSIIFKADVFYYFIHLVFIFN